MSLCLYDELVDTVKPGDRISLTGIFRSVPVRLNPRQRVIKALFKTYLDVVHIKKTDAKRMGVDTSTRAGESRRGVVGVGGEEGLEEEGMDIDFADGVERARTSRADFEEKLVELSRREDIYEYLARSLAPSIWEMDDIKKGILLQLFGGTNKTIARGGGGGGPRYRGDINVLLVGDPGTSKSQILQVGLHPLRRTLAVCSFLPLQYVHKIAPRGVYTSGKGSSAVGLTAYVTRDPDSKQLVLERFVVCSCVLHTPLTLCCTTVERSFYRMEEYVASMNSIKCPMLLVVYFTKSWSVLLLLPRCFGPADSLPIGTTNRFDRKSWDHHDAERSNLHSRRSESGRIKVQPQVANHSKHRSSADAHFPFRFALSRSRQD